MVAHAIVGVNRAIGGQPDTARCVCRLRARAPGERSELARSKSHSLMFRVLDAVAEGCFCAERNYDPDSR